MTLNTRLEQISIDLNRLRELDPNYKALSNASYHRYKMKPTWSEQQIKAFERKNQIILPDDFRDFLL